MKEDRKMIKCLNGGCPKGKEICCRECDEIETCDAACDSEPTTCGDSALEVME